MNSMPIVKFGFLIRSLAREVLISNEGFPAPPPSLALAIAALAETIEDMGDYRANVVRLHTDCCWRGWNILVDIGENLEPYPEDPFKGHPVIGPRTMRDRDCTNWQTALFDTERFLAALAAYQRQNPTEDISGFDSTPTNLR